MKKIILCLSIFFAIVLGPTIIQDASAQTYKNELYGFTMDYYLEWYPYDELAFPDAGGEKITIITPVPSNVWLNAPPSEFPEDHITVTRYWLSESTSMDAGARLVIKSGIISTCNDVTVRNSGYSCTNLDILKDEVLDDSYIILYKFEKQLSNGETIQKHTCERWGMVGQNIFKIKSESKWAGMWTEEDLEALCVPPNSFNFVGTGGGCLIATATYGSELAPQVQLLREIRDNSLLQTESGTNFMNYFNDVYYSFSPYIADYERENPVFKEIVRITITPMIASLSILNYVDVDSEESVLGYGISLIVLNLVMYVGVPASVIVGFRKI